MTCFFRSCFIAIASLVLCGIGDLNAARQISEDRDLKEISLTGWDCINRSEGTARNPEGNDRNRLKNRVPIDLSKINIPSFDTAGFLRHVGVLDPQLAGKRRKDLAPQNKKQIEPFEKQLVSLTGYIVLAYAGPPETTNCGSTDFHDWHLEVCEKPADHPPQPGDPTPIICEITPRTQSGIYRDGIRIQELAAFFRQPNLTYESTGHKALKVRLTGYLLWDDEHNDEKDVGTTIRTIARNKYHNPWRSTAWEIHPVIKIERLEGGAPPTEGHPPPTPPETSPAEAFPPPQATPEVSPPPIATPVPTATPQRYVTILRAVKLKIPYGETVLPRGTRLPIISTTEQTVVVEYLGQRYPIPRASTDLRMSSSPQPSPQSSP